MIHNVLFCGVGGQGILTCSRVLSLAALHAGLDVKMSEVHGMSQRGGSVDTHVRIGRDVPSAMVPQGGAHMLVAFEKLEALRYLEYLRGDGVVYTCPLEIYPLGRSLKKGEGYLADVNAVLEERAPRLVWVDAVGIADALGDPRLVNMAMLGALSRSLPIGPADWDAAVRQRFKGSAAVKCLEAFDLGGDIL